MLPHTATASILMPSEDARLWVFLALLIAVFAARQWMLRNKKEGRPRFFTGMLFWMLLACCGWIGGGLIPVVGNWFQYGALGIGVLGLLMLWTDRPPAGT